MTWSMMLRIEQHCSAEGGTGGRRPTSFPTGVHILEMGGDLAVSHDTSSNGDPNNHRDVRNQQCWKDISEDPSQTAGTGFYQRMYHSMTRIPEASGAGEKKYDDLIIFGGQDRHGFVGNALYRRTLLSSGQWSWVSVTSANDGTGSGYSTDGTSTGFTTDGTSTGFTTGGTTDGTSTGFTTDGTSYGETDGKDDGRGRLQRIRRRRMARRFWRFWRWRCHGRQHRPSQWPAAN